MAQATLGSFEQENPRVKTRIQILVLILKDLNVAWNDRDWYLHSQDLVYLDEELASILVERGIARELNIGGIEQ